MNRIVVLNVSSTDAFRYSKCALVSTSEGMLLVQFGGPLFSLAREQFAYPAAEQLFKKLEHLSQRSGVSRGVAFEDWLTAMVCTLAAETKEGEYLAMIERHKAGKQGNRGVDVMGQMFGELVNAMSDSDSDILGDLFQGSITYGEAGQYFTPESV